MKTKLSILLSGFLILLSLQVKAQSFSDDFEAYTVGTYLADSSTKWTTWNNAPGSSEDVLIDNNRSASGSKSIYFESQWGYGPHDVVLPFGGMHTSGKFKFKSKWFVTPNTGAYFNLQGGASIGSSWALDVYMYDDGTVDYGGYLSGSYPQGQWFELEIDIDFDQNTWNILIDGVSQGSFSNNVNSVSYLDIFPIFSGTAFWVDDVSYCINASCLPDISLDNISISPDPICTNQGGDVIVTLTNNGPGVAKGFTLGVASDAQAFSTRAVVLDDLAMGDDTTITIPAMFKTNTPGSNVRIRAASMLGDRYILNDTAETFIDVVKSPSGSELVKGSVFQGVDGGNSAPDLIEVAKTNSYEITPPTGYSNTQYPAVWNIASVDIRTEGGFVLPGSAYQYNAPTSSSNGNISFTGSNAFLDSLLIISFRVANVSSGCDSTTSRKLRVVPTPKTNFSFDAPVCAGDNVAFQNLSTIHSGFITYMWYFGDGDTSDMNDPYHQYLSAGSYNVRLRAISHPYLIVKDTTITLLVSEIPETKFSIKNKCLGVAVEFANASSVSSGTMSYDWDFGDGSAHSSATNPSHAYSQHGAYKVTLRTETNGCVSTLTKTAYTFEKPLAAFTPPTAPFCANTDLAIANESQISFGNLGTLWTMGDGFSTTQYNVKHAYASAGTYRVTLLAVSEFDCKDSVSANIVIKPSPTPLFSGNQFCGKIPTVFTNNTVEDLPNPVYTWTFSDGFTSNQKSLTRSWPSEGPYTVNLHVAYSNGCSGSASEDIKVLIQPKSNFSVQDICSGESASFVNLSKGDRENIQYFWDFGNGTNSSSMAPVKTFSPGTTTTYTVALITSYAGGCSDTMRKQLTVSEAPVCDFTFKDLGLLKESFTPSNTTYSKYEWFFGEGGTSVQTAPVYQYLYSGTFNVTMKATNAGGCDCEITKRVGATTGVNDVTGNSGISIYPNPNNGHFTVSNAAGNAMKVDVYNVLGEKVYSKATSEDSLLVNLEDHAKGIYLVKITINGVTITTKLTVTN